MGNVLTGNTMKATGNSTWERSLLVSIVAFFVAVFAVLAFSQATSAATIKQVTTGNAHACAITDNKLKCWGNNASGQLGNNSKSNSSTPVSPYTKAAWSETVKDYCRGGITIGDWCSGSWVYKTNNYPDTPLHGKAISKVSAGQYHTCAIAGAKVYCWGNNASGQLGNNSTADSSQAVEVVATGALKGKEVVDVTAGDGFTCTLATDGTVACWGKNNNGQLGNSTRSDSRVPVAVSKAAYTPAVPAHCSGTPNPVIGCAGNVYWVNEVPAIPASALQDKKVKKLASLKGDTATMCAITTEEKAVCWGQNDFGEAGNGRAIPARTVKATGKGEDTNKNRCAQTDREAKSAAMKNINLPNADVLRPAAVSSDLKFDSLEVVASGAGADSLEEGDTKTYAYVTANTASSSASPSRAFYWGGSLSYSLDVDCVINTDYQDHGGQGGRAESTKSTATLELLLSGVSTPRGALYTSEKSNQLRNQQIALISGNASIGANYVQLCATRTEPYWFTTRDVTVCDSARSGLVCASTVVSRDAVACDTGAQTCTDNSDGSAFHIALLKATNQYVQTCTPNGPQPVPSSGASLLKPGQAITALDTGFSSYTCAVTNTNKLGCWGKNSKGQLGVGDTKDKTVPTEVRL